MEPTGEIKNDTTGQKLGMWLFLLTEILLFGTLFVLYSVYYAKYTADFASSGKELNLLVGAANTVILLISSFTVVCAITALRQNDPTRSIVFLILSISLGMTFLVNKYFEWGHKFATGHYPGSELISSGPVGKSIYLALYYIITGLHGLHVLIGTLILLLCALLIHYKRITQENYILLENSGLYWHLVDLIWIFVFPLFYLIA